MVEGELGTIVSSLRLESHYCKGNCVRGENGERENANAPDEPDE
jgi:hypothetical protein